MGGLDEAKVGTQTTRSRPLLAHWDGRAWKVTRSPIRWGYVEAIVHATNGAWATLRNRDGAFLLRWNGTGWRVTAPPANESSATLAYGPRGSAWLIGNYVYERQAGSWRRLSALGRVTQRDSLWTSRSSGELWRITHFGPAHTRPPLIARWDGTRWVQTAPRLSRFTDPANIVVFSRTEAWLAGTDGDHALLFRWDGTRWRRVPGPPRAAIDATAYTTGTHTLWLAGSTTNAAVTLFPPYLMRNQGTGWKPMPPPTSEDADNFTLYAVGKETWATTTSNDDLFRLVCA